MRLLCSLFIVHFSLFTLSGFDARGQATALHFEHLTISEGLSHNTVTCILQDRSGFLWFGTQEGLNRYDGYTFRTERQKRQDDTLGFCGHGVQCLLEDKKGSIWVGMQDGGINIRDGKTGLWTHSTQIPALRALRGVWVKTIFADRAGNVWIGSIGKGLYCYTPARKTIEQFTPDNSALTTRDIFDITQDQSGTIWVAASGKGIYAIDGSPRRLTLVHSDTPKGGDIDSYRKTLLFDGKETLWIGVENNGLYSMNLTTRHFEAYYTENGLSSSHILDLTMNREGELLIATDGGGLSVLNPVTRRFTNYHYESNRFGALNSSALYSLLVDRNDNLWVGTYNGGINVCRAHKPWFETMTRVGGLLGEISHRSVLSIAQTKEGKVYVGTDGGGLNVYDPVRQAFTAFTHHPNDATSIGGDVVKTIFEDSHQNLWLGFFGEGLDCYNPARHTFKHYRNRVGDDASLAHNNVWAITEDHKGNLWLGTLGGGLARYVPSEDRFYPVLATAQGLPERDIFALLNDHADRLWIGTTYNGAFLYDPISQRYTAFRHVARDTASLSANDVRCFLEDRKGNVWIGTESGGLNLYTAERCFKHYTSRQGLLSDAVMGLAEDEAGYIWITTFEGISRLDPRTGSVLNFDFHQSTISNQFNAGAVVALRSGELLFGGINALNSIRAATVAPDTLQPRIVLTDFKIFNTSVDAASRDGRILQQSLETAEKVVLSYLDNVFSFEFACLDYTPSSKNIYAYRMEGFDEEWRTTSVGQRTVTYTNLDPGTYVFHVRGANIGGRSTQQEARIRVVITPPFWQTVWFRVLSFLVAVGLLFVVVRFIIARREMQLKEQVLESEKEILNLKNEKLEAEVATKNADLMSKAVQMAHKNEILIGIRQQLDAARNAPEVDRARSLRTLVHTIEGEIHGEESWEQFLSYFDQVNQNFMTHILRAHPHLTQNDLRICALSRLNMSTKEMASLLNITIKGVEKSRSRLKKRLGLEVTESLAEYLRRDTFTPHDRIELNDDE